MQPRKQLSTECAHAGEEEMVSVSTPSVMPIYQTSVYNFADFDVLDGVYEAERPGFIYGRFGLPNTVALEDIVARLEGAEAALASASGMASIMVALTTLLEPGDEAMLAQDAYGGTVSLAVRDLPHFGFKTRLITDTRPGAVQSNLRPQTKVLLIETLSNPVWNVADIGSLAEVCLRAGVKLIVDNTAATPCIVRPLTIGADVVVHSATKFLAGHHDVTAGVLAGSREFIARARASAIRLGPSLSPFDAWLAVRGIKTLALRMERSCSNALEVARFLDKHPRVRRVYYPGLESHAQHDIVKRTMGGLGGPMLSFDMHGDTRSADAFIKNLSMIRFTPSFGGPTTTVSHPAKTSHRSLTEQQRAELQITDTLMRLSVGIEEAQDIIDELARALDNAI
jgi:cystathionine beta-lyase/cystathionine gamma-synthase